MIAFEYIAGLCSDPKHQRLFQMVKKKTNIKKGLRHKKAGLNFNVF